MQHNNKTIKVLDAFTLVETLIAMSLIAVLFVLIMQALSSMLLGSLLIEARTAVRTEGEFVGEYLKLRIKNADPASLVCDDESDLKPITWQTKGSSDTHTFYFDEPNDRFCLDNDSTQASACDTVLTYNDVIVHDVIVNCESTIDDITGQQFTTVNLMFDLDSTQKYGDGPAVANVSRFINIAIR